MNVVIENNRSTTNKKIAEKYNMGYLIIPRSTYALFLPSPINEIHLITYDWEHIKFNKKEKRFQQIGKMCEEKRMWRGYKANYSRYHGKLIYDPSQKILFFFSFETKLIYFCVIDSDEQTEFEWKLFDVYLPKEATRMGSFDVISIKNNIVMIYFVNGCHHIYFVDLYHKKVFESEQTSMDYYQGGHLVQCGNMIHLLGDSWNTIHIKWCFSDIMPKQMINYYRKTVYDPLIFGFVKQFENENKLYHAVPFYITKLIISFYSQFVY